MNDHHQARDWGIGASSGMLAAMFGWLKPLGDVASHVGAIATCIISLVMLYRVVLNKNGKENKP